MTYADSGFVVSLYLTTEGTSELARKEVKRASNPILLSRLSLLEIRNALNFGINRDEITSEQRDAVLSEIDAQIEKGFFRLVDAKQTLLLGEGRNSDDQKSEGRLLHRSEPSLFGQEISETNGRVAHLCC